MTYENHLKKIAVLFPGIGYTCDKPLLYYGGKLAAKLGYEVKAVPYGNFQPGVKGNAKKMEDSFYFALDQACEILKDISWGDYDEIVFMSKSIGTIVSSCYAKEKGLKVRSVLFTPLIDTFRFAEGDVIMFHGTADQWADTSEIVEAAKTHNIPLYITENANHSLETGDVILDTEHLPGVMKTVKSFLEKNVEATGD